MSSQRQASVAVIGAGAQGLVTVKNLLEQGFHVTGFDKNDYVGGLWHYAADHHITALPSTVVNVSR
jgi:dimethylaniline monooxygenase (N-oxide forming)